VLVVLMILVGLAACELSDEMKRQQLNYLMVTDVNFFVEQRKSDAMVYVQQLKQLMSDPRLSVDDRREVSNIYLYASKHIEKYLAKLNEYFEDVSKGKRKHDTNAFHEETEVEMELMMVDLERKLPKRINRDL